MTTSQKPIEHEPTDDEIRNDLEKTQWGKTFLTDFLHRADRNTRITYLKLKGCFEMLESVGDIFRLACDNIRNTDKSNGVIVLLLGGAWRNYLAAVRLASSCQLTESYVLLRACIENALYAFNVYKEPKLAQIWIDRHKDGPSKKDCKKHFQLKVLQDKLISSNPLLGQEIQKCYESCIDYGAHPNEWSVALNLTFADSGISVALLNTNEGLLQSCLLNCARFGIVAIEVFNLIYPDDFKKFNVEQRIKAIRNQGGRIWPEISYKLRSEIVSLGST